MPPIVFKAAERLVTALAEKDKNVVFSVSCTHEPRPGGPEEGVLKPRDRQGNWCSGNYLCAENAHGFSLPPNIVSLNNSGQWPASRRLRAGPRPAESARPSPETRHPPCQGLGLEASTARGSRRWNPTPRAFTAASFRAQSKAAAPAVSPPLRGRAQSSSAGSEGSGHGVACLKLRRQGGVHSHLAGAASRRPRGNRRPEKTIPPAPAAH